MLGSLERVRAVINGEVPDRPPLYELLRNDAVIEYFSGDKLNVENGARVVYQAYAPAVDATRPLVRTPNQERVIFLEDGRAQRYSRWTIWTEPRRYDSSEAYAACKLRLINSFNLCWNERQERVLKKTLSSIAEERRRLGEVFFFARGPAVELSDLYDEVGLESFSYYLVDCPEVIDQLLECNTVRAVTWVEHLPEDHDLEAVFFGDDLAHKDGPLFHPSWLAKHYFPRLARVIAAYHAKKIRVLFHSDGNLNPILEQLVETGIDGLNPIEVLAGMDVGDIHRKYPHLFLAGGIDVSELLTFSSPQQIKDNVKKTIEAAGGRIMIGTTTELHDQVPLSNYLALREAVLESEYS